MSRWFRHYAGMMRDEKLVRVAVRSKQPVERVIWVWGAILESAAELNDNGRYEFDAGEASYFLRCDADEIGIVLAELEHAGRLVAGVVARWGDRQFSSDAGAERQRRYRERRKSDGQELPAKRNGDCGVTSRDAEVTLQDTRDREHIQKEEPNGSSKKKRGMRIPDDFEPDLNWACVNGVSSLDVEREAAQFKDFWRAKPGKDGLKLDWPATWRTWVRNYAKRLDAVSRAPPKPKSIGEMFRDDAKRMGLIDDDAADDNSRHLEASNGHGEDGGTGIARRFAVSGNLLGKLG